MFRLIVRNKCLELKTSMYGGWNIFPVTLVYSILMLKHDAILLSELENLFVCWKEEDRRTIARHKGAKVK